ncbi:MAG TPA: DUF4124 domain-containing protein [Burkholderiales bacterium]|nr:DUF4124 domain-containing protein [Burkholderiales bacterium]
MACLAAFGGARAAFAQAVYKYTDDKGGTVYTDDPKSAPRKAERVDIPPRPEASPAPQARLSEADQRLLGEAQRRAAELDRATDDIVAASRMLREAQDRFDRGVEPQEGERQGRRFRPEYWQRRQAEEREVEVARARLDDAIARRNALR